MSPMNVAKKLMLLKLGGAGSGGAVDTSASFTVTTTGAETLTITAFTVTAATTIDWGDGSSNSYTGSGSRTHNYAGAGTWTMRILEPLNVTELRLQDAKITTLAGEQLARLTNLTSLTIITLTGLSWTVGAATPMPTGLNILTLYNMPGLSWTVGAAAPMPVGMEQINFVNMANLTWAIGAAAPLPATLVYLQLRILPGVTNISTFSGCPELGTIQIENTLSTAQINALLADVWAAFATRTKANGTIDLLGGSNEGPTGPVAAENPPTYGGAYAYELVNDTGNVNPTKKWASVTTATPV